MDEYDVSENDDSSSAYGGIFNSLTNLGTEAATGYLQQSGIIPSYQPVYSGPPLIPRNNNSIGSFGVLIIIAIVGLILYKVL